MKQIIRTALAFVVVLASASLAGAQDARVVVTPLLESGSYSRSMTHDPASGYETTATKSDTTQKGVIAEFRGASRWSTKARFTTGSIGTPTYHNRLTDGTKRTEPYSQASNSNVEFAGKSRSLEVMEEFAHGPLTYRFGLVYRLLEHTDYTTIFGAGSSYSESEFVDTYLGPRFGVTARHSFGRLAAAVSIDVSPWMRNSGTYEFRLQNSGNSFYERSASSKALDLDLGASFRIMKNLGVVGGWRYSGVHTDQPLSSFFEPNPSGVRGIKTPQKDSWQGAYVGLQIFR